MSLTNRLTAFFLIGLALVLAGFSVTLFLLAHSYLNRQLDERLTAAMNTLVAAAEIEHDKIEWQIDDRRMQVGGTFPEAAVQWAVHSGEGRLVDAAADVREKDRLHGDIAPAEPLSGFLPDGMLGEDRRALRQVLSIEAASTPRQSSKPLYSTLVFTVATSEKPTIALLHRLAATLAITSLTIWLIGLFAGRWFCRRALRPVAAMAEQARAMHNEEPEQRLRFPSSGDEIEALGQSFNGLLDRLYETLERQQRFTGDASHQLRTPLAALIGQVEVALRHPRTIDEYRETLAQVQQQALHLGQIVEMLLYLTRADAEARLDTLELVDLAKWLPDHLQLWSSHSRSRDLQYMRETEKLCQVKAHPPLLGQLLDNLIDNAFKYSNAGSQVVVRLGIENGTGTISVEDSGMGIGDVDLPHVFEPFYRSESARAQGRSGIGLGLSVAQRIAHLFNGAISASGNKGKGSCFVLNLPLQLEVKHVVSSGIYTPRGQE